MRRRILLAILSVTAMAIGLFGVPLALVVPRFVDEQATGRLERHAVLASREVPADFASGEDPVELPDSTDGVTFGLYNATGSLVTGQGPPTADEAVRLALGNQVVDREVGETRVVAVPVAADEVVIGAIRAGQSTSAADARTGRILAVLGGLAVAVLAIGAAIGYIVAGRLTRPVRRLRDAAVQLGDGDFALAVPRSRVPELDEAAVAMTATAQRLDDLVARERSFSADASHQLRTPLAGLRATIETELELPRADRAEVLTEALSDIDRLESTIGDLLAIARTPAADDGSSTSLVEVFAELDAAWTRRFARADRQLIIAPARYAPEVVGNPAMLRHALDVLLDNALRHGAGTVEIRLTSTDDAVTLTITDEGPGFTSSPVPTPTDASQSAHGFGLPLAQRLIAALPGRLTITQPGPQPQIDITLRRNRR